MIIKNEGGVKGFIFFQHRITQQLVIQHQLKDELLLGWIWEGTGNGSIKSLYQLKLNKGCSLEKKNCDENEMNVL